MQQPNKRGIQTMEASVAAREAPTRDPHLPRLHRLGDLIVPSAPQQVAAAGLEEGTLKDLTVRLAFGAPRFTGRRETAKAVSAGAFTPPCRAITGFRIASPSARV